MVVWENMRAILVANTAWYLYNHRISLAHALRERGAEVILLSPYDEYVDRLVDQGFNWRSLRMSRRGINPFSEIATSVELFKLYSTIKPDVVHHFTIKPVLYGSLVARLMRVPLIINAITGLGYLFGREGMVGRILQWLAGVLYRLVLKSESIVVVFQNSSDQDLFSNSGWVNKQQSVLIPGSGVDTDRFVPTPESEHPKIVLMVSRMLWDKGVGDFVAAARILKQRNVEADFVLVGGSDMGNPRAVPGEQLEKWTQMGIVKWLGHQDEMPQIYAQSTIVVLPTNYREGVPRTLIEAAASGKPIITTDLPGCRDIVRHGINGILIPVEDPISLADAIEELLINPDLREKMGRAGREIAVNEFSNQKIIKATLELYRT